MSAPFRLAPALFRLLALLLAAVVLGVPAPAAAQREIDPQQIALTPADLPPGFSVDASQTSYRRLADDTLTYQVQMEREPTRENLLDGPIAVRQIIFRAGGEI